MLDEDRPEKSKSQVKRDLAALQKLGRDLVDVPGRSLERLPLSDATRDAVRQAKTLKMGALQRHLKYLGKLMRNEDTEAVRSALADLKNPHAEDMKRFHEVETWRDALLAGDDERLEQLCSRYPAVDRQRVRQLVRNANKEQALDKPPATARVLFRYLKDVISDDR